VITEPNSLSRENTHWNMPFIIHTVARIALLMQVKVRCTDWVHGTHSSYSEGSGFTLWAPDWDLPLFSVVPRWKCLNNTCDETLTASADIRYLPVCLALSMCVNKVMRLILYKIIYSVIRLNQHCLLKNNSPLIQHSWPSEFFRSHNKIGCQLLLGSWWRWLHPSERCQVIENDSP
jgi:hypothetical protein